MDVPVFSQRQSQQATTHTPLAEKSSPCQQQVRQASSAKLNLSAWAEGDIVPTSTGPLRPWAQAGADTESTAESHDTSQTSTSEHSASQTCSVGGPCENQAQQNRSFFAPKSPPQKELVVLKALRPPVACRTSHDLSNVRASDAGSSSGATSRKKVPRQALPEVWPGESAVPATTEVSAKAISRGRQKIKLQKFAATGGLIGANFMFIFATWWWPGFWFIYLPVISFPLVLNCLMIASIIVIKLRNIAKPRAKFEPQDKQSFVMIIPCYNETVDECTRSLDSLVDQVGINEHKKAIMIICDGRVRGPGMEKTTADHLLEDILVDQLQREKITEAYTAWNNEPMDIEISKGTYKGVPFYCIVKGQNQGKRDSLIVIRSFLHKFNIRGQDSTHIFSSCFFSSMSRWLSHTVGMRNVDHLIGMDADTVFAPDCILELLRESTYAHTVGVCGYVAVDFSGGNWNLWSLYQNAEYAIAQGLRRLHQSIATHKVSCLPGCCQLIKVCETTCGDRVLIELFGYHPKPTDGMLKQIRATASEDRNHVCLMLTTYPEAQTRQALRAKAYTDVPHSSSVFLSQRRRWTLGATSNDLLLFTARHCQWWERILAFSNVLTWCLNVFVIAAIGCMIVAFMSQPVWIIMAFVGVMLVPMLYYLVMTIWLPHGFRERLQYLAGLCLFVFCGPFLNITVMVFAVWNMDSFGWGKTRKIVEDDKGSASEPEDPSRAGEVTEEARQLATGGQSRTAGTREAILEKRPEYDEEATRTPQATYAMRSVLSDHSQTAG